MSKYTPRSRASALALPLVGAALLALGAACKSDSSRADTTALKTDSALSRDLALAGRDTTVQPQLKDVPPQKPATAAPAAPPTAVSRPAPRERPRTVPREPVRRAPEPPVAAPAPTPSAPVTTASGNTRTTNAGGGNNPGANGGGSVGTIDAGATLTTHANSRICTDKNAVGDRVTASLENTVTGSNGASIPAGATLNLTVTRLKRSENSNDPIVMEFAVNSVTFSGRTYQIEGTVSAPNVERVRDESQAKDVQKVATGAVAGAVLGRIFGKSTKATVIGGAVGAAGGAAAASATANYQGCIASGGTIVVRLTSPATVRV